jgi:hypothetical protein
MARDLFHYAVRAALEKEKWVITDDPLKVGAGGAKFEIDQIKLIVYEPVSEVIERWIN